jgi:DNA-binding NarL/FixJ family response regulator/GGDEF domain-containing protein
LPGEARILVIDDQPYFRRLVQGLLGERGLQVAAAAGAAAGWEVLEREGPRDLVVLDLMLEDADGIETLVRLRERWPEQRVLVLSSVSDPRAAVAAMRAGAADYLLKPIDRDALPLAVERALAEPAAPGTAKPAALDTGLLARAADLLALRDRAAIEHELLGLFCAQAGARDGMLWTLESGRYRLAAVCGDLPDDGTAPQRPALGVAAESVLRGGESWTEPAHDTTPASLYLPCARGGELVAVARLVCPERADAEQTREACARIAALGAAALAGAASGPADPAFREPRTGLPGRAFLEEVGRLELNKAQRYGRRVSVVCAEVGGMSEAEEQRAVPAIVAALLRALRSTDALASEGSNRFWVLVSDADPLGGVVLKRRLGQRLRAALADVGVRATLSFGASGYPNDAERFDGLCVRALERLRDERAGLAPALAIDEDTPLASIGAKLLERALWLPAGFVAEAADLVIGDVSSRPRDRGLLFLAPGDDRRALLEPLGGLADAEIATEVFVATDGETLPVGPTVTALGLPPDVPPDTTWIVRFGEAPPYALIAGRPRSDGARPVFHTLDAGIVEHLAFRLRAEIGFGVRG